MWYTNCSAFLSNNSRKEPIAIEILPHHLPQHLLIESVQLLLHGNAHCHVKGLEITIETPMVFFCDGIAIGVSADVDAVGIHRFDRETDASHKVGEAGNNAHMLLMITIPIFEERKVA